VEAEFLPVQPVTGCFIVFDNSGTGLAVSNTSWNCRFLFADQDVVVIGGGDTAMEDALVLARTSRSVVVIHRRDKFRASKVQSLFLRFLRIACTFQVSGVCPFLGVNRCLQVLAERVLSHSKIKVRWDSEVVSFQVR
jgi:hypothetical protein